MRGYADLTVLGKQSLLFKCYISRIEVYFVMSREMLHFPWEESIDKTRSSIFGITEHFEKDSWVVSNSFGTVYKVTFDLSVPILP